MTIHFADKDVAFEAHDEKNDLHIVVYTNDNNITRMVDMRVKNIIMRYEANKLKIIKPANAHPSVVL
jgi:hypothetical protein